MDVDCVITGLCLSGDSVFFKGHSIFMRTRKELVFQSPLCHCSGELVNTLPCCIGIIIIYDSAFVKFLAMSVGSDFCLGETVRMLSLFCSLGFNIQCGLLYNR
ncbi:hypothetical protein GOP47_0021140 [Adiantum capillus-veneris]|uniref:Uncharacterized protein n=1 Tax=Adiantum capillus-veneris TaxID=13818 RepID=A0A9D4UB25_ADICA|nr:hypothetical protein GOP47_0021140 [Adiantum capillus-veneris]